VRESDRESGESGVVSDILQEAEDRRESIMTAIWDWTRSIAVALVLFVGIRTLVIEAFKIPTSSMEDTLLVGDFLLVNKLVYGAEVPGVGVRLPALAEPRRGDIVVFTPPHEPGRHFVKRLVGAPGDTLQMRSKRLWVNGHSVDEPYARFDDRRGDAVHPDMRWQSNHLIARSPPSYRPTRDNWGPLVVPPDQYFVLGDNRDNSEDSRYWGFVPRRAITGKPWLVYYSFDAATPEAVPWLRSIRWRRIGARIR
jgi:signal peptidase I